MDHVPHVKALRRPKILVVPLDWGLGHATRCIPVIYELIRQDVEVVLAGEGNQRAVLENEFPQLIFLDLSGYRVRYSKSGRSFQRKILLQAPKILTAIRNEHRWLKEIIKRHKLDAVISDNRFGLYNKSIPSVFITHQLNIHTGSPWLTRFVQKINQRYISRFCECWIPDFADLTKSVAGELSHSRAAVSINKSYLGILSRFKTVNGSPRKNHICLLLSGPEPQRTILENKFIDEISHYNGTATIIRGLPGSKNILPSTNDIRIFNHLPTSELESEISASEYVICRSGYSSVMDLVTMGKKGILIPTPGQGEQEYLAAFLLERKIAFSISQHDFSLEKALEMARAFNYEQIINQDQLLPAIIAQFLARLKKNVN